jgi:hypothetical protein
VALNVKRSVGVLAAAAGKGVGGSGGRSTEEVLKAMGGSRFEDEGFEVAGLVGLGRAHAKERST